MTRCPECYQGKHDNCTGWAFDERDQEQPCGCQECLRTEAVRRVAVALDVPLDLIERKN